MSSDRNPSDPPLASSPADVVSIVEHLAHLLPTQGPIGVFIHHNTLHAFQDQKFEDAVVDAAELFGTEPYFTEAVYRSALSSGRIVPDDVDAILAAEDKGEILLNGATSLKDLRRAMLIPGVRRFRPETITWELEEGLLDSQPARELFDHCLSRTPEPPPSHKTATRPRDAVLQIAGVDLDDVVHPLLIKLSSAFLDQGLAYWSMPNRDAGFWTASLNILREPSIQTSELRQLPRFVRAASGQDGLAGLRQGLDELGVPAADRESFLQAELLALPGWAGMMHCLEQEPELAPHQRVPAKLVDFLAVRLLLTVAATASVLGRADAWRGATIASNIDRSAIRLAQAATYFDVAQLLGLSRTKLEAAGDRIHDFFSAIDSFGDWERRRVWHLAYERRHERQILLPLAAHSKRQRIAASDRVAAQIFFCLDEREESIRRHLEEIDPAIETLSSAGFYGVAMNYAGIDDAHGVALCPVVVKPRHSVSERPSQGHEELLAKRTTFRRYWAGLMRQWSVSSRTLVRGWLGVSVLGLMNIVPLIARVLSPRHYGNLINWINDAVLPEPKTELAFVRADNAGHHDPHALGVDSTDSLLQGFTLEEKIDRVAGMLRPAGLHRGMARLVLTLGHGSTSLNNPHESAHDCGACGGRRGGPNGRLFAAMANRPEVRRGLRDRDIIIPDDTWFVGGYHDTCSDDVDLYDLDAVPVSHQGDLARVRASLDHARELSAQERARRFEAASPGIDPSAALHHMQERAEHLSEPRPEYGHCTNAVCIVGKRASTRGLFFDRRAFLISYDAALDPNNSSLAALLNAAIPVCAGINLEYYFSVVDNEGYGCGTKLPHNVTGLLGIMNGGESDLRTGLPWQMVEIHEPVRCLFVLETTRERALAAISGNPALWQFLDNRWIRLAVQDPSSDAIHVYREGKWEQIEGNDVALPIAASSRQWYAGHREHLNIAEIDAKHHANEREVVNA